jgi:hypothetical protein
VTRLTFRLFGFPIFTFDLEQLVPVEEYEEDEDAPAVGGGSAHNFTLAAPYVDERYEPWEEDRTIGFRRPQ